LKLADLGVTKSHSRPYVSDDNPFSESQFKTMKYRPEFPDRVGSLEVNYRIDNGGCGLGQRLGSGLCSVHLENVSGDVYDDIVIHALKLEKWLISGDLKPRYQFGRGFLPPAA
jgi:transposase InsO family protein